MFDDQLQTALALIFIDVWPVHQLDLFGYWLGLLEQNGVELLPALMQFQFEMFFSYHPLMGNVKHAPESGLWKALPPHLPIEFQCGLQMQVCRSELAIGGMLSFQEAAVEPFAADCFKRIAKGCQVRFADGQASGSGVAAEFEDQLWVAFGNQVKCIAQM